MKRPKGGRPRRTIQKRDPRRVIRVLTEGKVTEPSYLAEWERRNRHVRLDTKEYGMAPRSFGAPLPLGYVGSPRPDRKGETCESNRSTTRSGHRSATFHPMI